MSEHQVHTHFPGGLVFIGFGSIGQGVLPLILRHVGGLTPDRITIVTADEGGREEAAKYGIKFVNHPLTRENYRHVLEPLIGRGDFVLNLSVDVSSIALITRCDRSGLGSSSSSVSTVGTICQDTPYRSSSQPHSPFRPPSESVSHSWSTSSCVSQFTMSEIAGVKVNSGPPLSARNS